MKVHVLLGIAITVGGLAAATMLLYSGAPDPSHSASEDRVPASDDASTAQVEIIAPHVHDEIVVHAQNEAVSDERDPAISISSDESASVQHQSLEAEASALSIMVDQLQVDDALSAHNLLLLRELGQRIAEVPVADEAELLSMIGAEAASPELISALRQLAAASRAEQDLYKQWQGKILQAPHAYQQALTASRKTHLGEDLYTALYAADTIVASNDGFTADWAPKAPEDNAPASNTEPANKKEELLRQWQRGESSEQDVREALLAEMSEQEVDDLFEIAQHEQDWLQRMGQFLDEYHYVEQAGLAGNDEQQLRQELIEKHFSPEDHATVNRFLFGLHQDANTDETVEKAL